MYFKINHGLCTWDHKRFYRSGENENTNWRQSKAIFDVHSLTVPYPASLIAAMIWGVSNPFNMMAPDRQEATQSPQPLQRADSIIALLVFSSKRGAE